MLMYTMFFHIKEPHLVRIIIQGVATGHPKENARKMSSGCQSTVDQLVAFVPKVQPLLHFECWSQQQLLGWCFIFVKISFFVEDLLINSQIWNTQKNIFWPEAANWVFLWYVMGTCRTEFTLNTGSRAVNILNIERLSHLPFLKSLGYW